MKTNFLSGVLFLFITSSVAFISCSKENSSEASQQGGVNGSNSVSIRNSMFTPSTIIITLDGTVTWINNDNVSHNVTGEAGGFSSGEIAPGSRYSYTFRQNGTFNYRCTNHSETGTVMVVIK